MSLNTDLHAGVDLLDNRIGTLIEEHEEGAEERLAAPRPAALFQKVLEGIDGRRKSLHGQVCDQGRAVGAVDDQRVQEQEAHGHLRSQ